MNVLSIDIALSVRLSKPSPVSSGEGTRRDRISDPAYTVDRIESIPLAASPPYPRSIGA